MGRPEQRILGSFENEFKTHNVHELAQAVEARIAFLGEHFEHVFSAEAGFFGELTQAAMDLGNVAEGNQEIAVIAVFHARVEIPHRSAGIF